MKRSHKIAAGIALSLSLGLAASVYAQPGQMGGGMAHGAQGGMAHGATTHGSGPQGRHAMMTSEERTAHREKMRNAATTEERQQIADAMHAEMQKRAQEKGVTMHEHRGPVAGQRATPGAAPQAPASAEHVH